MSNATQTAPAAYGFVVSAYTTKKGKLKQAVSLAARIDRADWLALHEKAKEHTGWWVKGAGWVFARDDGATAFLAECGGVAADRPVTVEAPKGQVLRLVPKAPEPPTGQRIEDGDKVITTTLRPLVPPEPDPPAPKKGKRGKAKPEPAGDAGAEVD